MDHVAPDGPVYQAGTLSGNPLPMAAGCVTLDALSRPEAYEKLEALSARLHGGLMEATSSSDIKVTINRVRLDDHAVLRAGPDHRLRERKDVRHGALRPLLPRHARARRLLPPAQFEAAFVSLAHSPGDIDATVSAARDAFRACGTDRAGVAGAGRRFPSLPSSLTSSRSGEARPGRRRA